MERAADLAKVGEGTIKFKDAFTVIGKKSKFTKQFKALDSIKCLTSDAEAKVADQIVVEIVSDTEMKLKSPGAQVYDPETDYKYKVLPKIDQSDLFQDVEKCLAHGGSLAIYPEGGSHDQSDFIPFKPGIAMMTFNTIIKTG